MYDICALGEILIDAIASADTSIQITGNAGGAPANVLTCASRMGLKTAFLAKAGDDFIGGWLKRVLDGVGIDTAGLILDSTKNTTIAMVSLDGSGNRSFSFYRTGCADVSLTKEDLRLDRIEQSRVFHFGSSLPRATRGSTASPSPTTRTSAATSGATSRRPGSISARA